jgi:hypothetical protein
VPTCFLSLSLSLSLFLLFFFSPQTFIQNTQPRNQQPTKMTTHPSSQTSTAPSSVAATGEAPMHAASATTTTHQATSQANANSNIDEGTGGFSTQVEPQILSHEEGEGWERTVTQVPGEEPVHSIRLAGHIKGIPGRR